MNHDHSPFDGEMVRNASISGSPSLSGRLLLPDRRRDPAAFATWLAEPCRRDSVVYAKPPFGGPERVLKYLAR